MHLNIITVVADVVVDVVVFCLPHLLLNYGYLYSLFIVTLLPSLNIYTRLCFYQRKKRRSGFQQKRLRKKEVLTQLRLLALASVLLD